MNKSSKIKIETVSISDLKPYPQNNKIHTEKQIKQIAKSISEFGFLQPLVVDKDNIIVVGHARFEALKWLGRNEVEVVKALDLSEEKIRLYRILDNKLSEDANFDINALKLEFEDLKDLDLFLDFELDGWDILNNDEAVTSIDDLDSQKEPNFLKVKIDSDNDLDEVKELLSKCLVENDINFDWC
jgi:hypothetical protein